MMAPGACFKVKVENLERYGFEGIELRILLDEATPKYLNEIEQAMSNSPLQVCSVIAPGSAYQLPLDSLESKEAKLAGAKSALDIGARFNAGSFITIEYKPQFPLPLWYRLKPLGAREKELFFTLLNEVVDYAEKVGAYALLEPINRYESHYYNRIEEVKAVIDKVGSPRLKIAPDFFHMNIEEVDMAASIREAAGDIMHIQLGDSNRELPGRGHTDFARGFAALRSIGYDRFLAIECRLPENPDVDFPDCVGYLGRCLEESKSISW